MIDITIEQARYLFENRANGRLDGINPSKGGRAWLEGEFTLDELESLCVMVRHEAGESADGAAEMVQRYYDDADGYGHDAADWIRPSLAKGPEVENEVIVIENAGCELIPDEALDQAHDTIEHLLREIRTIYEAGRDRIMALGGTCDDVDTMFRHTPALRDARALVNFQH